MPNNCLTRSGLQALLSVLAVAAATTARPQALDLCQGLLQDKQDRPLTVLAKPALLQAVREPQFGTTLRRVTAVSASGANPVLKPMYSPVSAWNADESRLLLYEVGRGHKLFDGRDYTFVKSLDVDPTSIESVFWHPDDPDLLFYPSGNRLVRYHVSTGAKDVVRTFTCSGDVVIEPHGFMSWNADVFSLRCPASGTNFFYRISTNAVTGTTASSLPPPLMAPSGTAAFRAGAVVDTTMKVLRTLDLSNPYEHASLGRLKSGRDTYNAVQFDPGPRGSGVGTIVTHDLQTAASTVVVGPATGFPYPPGGTHLSAVAYRQPGWVYASVVGNPAGQKLLDNEIVLADTNTGKVCRVGRHRSYGDENTTLGNNYWAEPHVVASPSGTRAVFGSDWGNGPTVDTYVFELPSYVWLDVAPREGDLDGDGKTDLVWSHASTRTVAVWLMDGSQVRASVAVGTLPGADWSVAGMADFNGDDRSDLLLRSATTGEVRIWLMNGGTVASQGTIGTQADLLGQVAATGDLDGDGRADIVWRHAGTGAVSAWLVNALVVKSKPTVAATSEAASRIVAAADFDGNGRADLLWRHGTTGAMSLWLMNGATVVSRPAIATIADFNWQILGTGDHDGDGRADLLLRNRVTGGVYLCLMNGAAVVSGEAVATVSDTNWQIVGSGDESGDGRADVLWRHRTTGALYLFVMNGAAISSAAPLPAVADLSWQTVRTP